MSFLGLVSVIRGQKLSKVFGFFRPLFRLFVFIFENTSNGKTSNQPLSFVVLVVKKLGFGGICQKFQINSITIVYSSINFFYCLFKDCCFLND